MDASSFIEYPSNLTHLEIILDFKVLRKLLELRMMKATDVISIIGHNHNTEFEIKFMDYTQKIKSIFNVSQAHNSQEEVLLQIPLMNYPAIFTMKSKEYENIIKYSFNLGKITTIEVKKKMIEFGIPTEFGKGKINYNLNKNYKKYKINVIEFIENVIIKVATKYLKLSITPVYLSELVKISILENVPLLVEYDLIGKESLFGNIKYYIAPFVDEIFDED